MSNENPSGKTKEVKKPKLVDDLNYKSLVSYVDENIRWVQLGVYSVAAVGLALAARSVRPFKKFTHPRQIPRSFFRKHVQLSGDVMRIDFGAAPTLVVDHRPLLLGGWRKPGVGLKVAIAGIDLTPNGVSWLQTLIVGHPVRFTVVYPQGDSVSSIVQFNGKDVANRLVSLGFASVSPYNTSLHSDKLYSKYYKSLLKLESKAESNRAGMWTDAPLNLLKFLLFKMLSNFDRFKPKSLKLN